ncbi:hypothetical protein DFJ77DRAFT_455560 [Powellomyces hirtus]|nr:hypothetical protein DFJ77DRAFT_455560 [Powellomyces hirtus]
MLAEPSAETPLLGQDTVNNGLASQRTEERIRRRNHRLAGFLIAALMVAGMITLGLRTSRHSHQPKHESEPPRMQWKPCYENGLLCSSLRVPLDYKSATGKSMSIALIRLPGSATNSSASPIFLNPGGPGASGIEFIRNLGTKLGKLLHGKYDLISFDPRGVGQSNAISCFETAAQHAYFDAQHQMLPASARTNDHESIAARVARDSVLAFSCRKKAGHILPYVSTAAVARDLDLLRAAMDQELLNYWGFSYGTLLGSIYANMFPDKVGKMVLDGVADPEAWIGASVELKPVSDDSLVDTEAVLDGFGSLCETAGPDQCALASVARGPSYSVADTLRKFLEELKLTPLVVYDGETPGILSQSMAAESLFMSLYKPRTWQKVASAFNDAITYANGTKLYYMSASSGPTDFCSTGGDSEDYSNLAVHCTDRRPFTDLKHMLSQVQRLAEMSPLAGAMWGWWASPCLSWNVTAAERYTGPWNATTRNKLLLIGNAYDPVTPFRHAKRL